MPRLPALAAEPAGLVHEPDFLSVHEERQVVAELETFEFSEVRMRGQVAKRTVLHFGLRMGVSLIGPSTIR